MKKCVSKLPSLVFSGVLLFGASPALAQGTVVYDAIPSPTPPNVPSQPFQAQQTFEFGDQVKLGVNTPHRAREVTVLMSNWAPHSDWASMPDAGFTHPITFNIYLDAASARAHTPVKTVTQTFLIPWRAEADPTCATPTNWRAPNGTCYGGVGVQITFDLRSLNYDLPAQFIYGIAYNTETWGYTPMGVGVGFQKEGTLGFQNLSPLTCPVA